jgi:hypothetical protein
MHEDFSKPRWQVSFGFAAALVVMLSLTGCYKKSGEAVVLEKEHIAVREATPTPQAESSPNSTEPTASSNASTPSEETVTEMPPGDANADASTPTEEVATELREDEVNVDGYVMKKEVRGTSKDPRAMDQERWIVRVQMIADLRRIDIQADQPQWKKLKIGDRVKVTYRQGKYTGTVWSAQISQ